MRLDKYLQENGFYSSREKSQIAIKKGLVLVDKKVVTKPSFEVTGGEIEIKEELLKYVSFGGNKLEHAITFFHLDFNGKTVLDIGASTGGFSDCALQNGAEKVVAIEVGKGQLHESLKNNPKLFYYEETNILDFITDEKFDYLVCDVSFVSITKIVASFKRYMTDKSEAVILIKPQFEAGKMFLKNGVVKDPKLHETILKDVISFLRNCGYQIDGLTYSKQIGKMGNIEYLAILSLGNDEKEYNFKELVHSAFDFKKSMN